MTYPHSTLNPEPPLHFPKRFFIRGAEELRNFCWKQCYDGVDVRKSIYKILFPWVLIVLSFLFASAWLDKKAFYSFDVIWRASIITGVYFFGKTRLSLSFKQWITLGLVFILNFEIVRVFSSSQPTLYIVLTIVLGPLSEEMFFRGWLISRIEGDRRDKIFKSSLFFSLYHLKNAFILTPLALAYQLLYTGLVVGPIFAWVRLRYNSLFPSTVLHSVNNMIGLTVTERLFPLVVKKSVKF